MSYPILQFPVRRIGLDHRATGLPCVDDRTPRSVDMRPYLLVLDARNDLLEYLDDGVSREEPLCRSALVAHIRHPEVAFDLDGPVKADHLLIFLQPHSGRSGCRGVDSVGISMPSAEA